LVTTRAILFCKDFFFRHSHVSATTGVILFSNHVFLMLSRGKGFNLRSPKHYLLHGRCSGIFF